DDYESVGYVDSAGILSDDLQDADGKDDFERFHAYPEADAARQALVAGEISAYFIVPEDYITSGTVSFFSEKNLPEALQDAFSDLLTAGIARQTPEAKYPERLQQPIDLSFRLRGEKNTLSDEAAILRFALPAIFGFIFVMNIITTSQFLMSGVVEEKENYIMEILFTSSRPLELIAGKVLGLGALAITQLVFWMGVGLTVGAATGRLKSLQEAGFEPAFIMLSVLYFLFSFLMFAGIMVGIGAAVSAEQESRQIAGVLTMIAILPPSWGFALFITSPHSLPVIAMSLFPLTSPLSMMILLGLGEAAAWQIVASLLFLFLTIPAVLWISARVYRAGMLMTGQRPGLKTLIAILWG
ncbi:MAG TPA: ABC transporter permease, partial [Aggregatilineales bacterium]|nr:ABC transporter permease [Aggregatilineales bacterium]